MALDETDGGVEYERRALDQVERHFWRDIWASVPTEMAAERGIERQTFGRGQATIVAALPNLGMLNLVLGATEPGAVDGGRLAAAIEWTTSRDVAAYVPVTPRLADTDAAEAWLADNDFAKGHAWMKFVRDAHPPRFAAPEGIDVVELHDTEQDPFPAIAPTAFGLPAWACTFFARLPGR